MRAKDRAATRIQAGFRGYRVRKQLRISAQNKRPNGPRRSSAIAADNGTTSPVQKTAGDAPKPKLSNDPERDSKDAETEVTAAASPTGPADALERSATKIQAGVRGFLVRRRRLVQHRAACTIQASFRAFRARREARLRAAAAAKI